MNFVGMVEEISLTCLGNVSEIQEFENIKTLLGNDFENRKNRLGLSYDMLRKFVGSVYEVIMELL